MSDEINYDQLFHGIDSMVMDRSTMSSYIVTDSGIIIPVSKIEGTPFLTSGRLLRTEYFPRVNTLRITTLKNDVFELELNLPGRGSPVNRRPTLYLDQRDWSQFSKFAANELVDQASSAQIMEWLRERKIIAPFSFAHVTETAQWGNSEKRYQLGLTIASLSRGWQILYPIKAWQTELVEVFNKRKGQKGEHRREIITLDPGSVFPDERAVPNPEAPITVQDLIQHFSQSVSYLSSYFEIMLDLEPTKRVPTPEWVEGFQLITDTIAKEATSKEMKREYAKHPFIMDTLIYFVAAAGKSRMTTEELVDWLVHDFDRDIREMRSLGYWYETFRQKHIDSSTRWKQNDLTDMLFLTCAAGYADFVVAEKSAVSYLRQSARKLNRELNVFSSVDDLRAELGTTLAAQAESEQLSNP